MYPAGRLNQNIRVDSDSDTHWRHTSQRWTHYWCVTDRLLVCYRQTTGALQTQCFVCSVHAAHICRRILLTLTVALSKCIVGPSVSGGSVACVKLLTQKFLSGSDGSVGQSVASCKYAQIPYPRNHLCGTTRENTWICQKSPIRRRTAVVWTRC